MSTIDEPPDSLAPPRRTLIEDLRLLPQPVWILCIGTFINRFGTFVVPFLTLYMTGNGFTKLEAGLTIGAIGLGSLLSAAGGGWLADRFGRRRTMGGALLLSGTCMLLLSFADSLTTFLIFGLMTGASHGLYHPAASALLADLLPPERRVLGYTVVRFAINLGWACGMAAGGLIAEYSYHWLFWGDALTSAIYGIIALLTLPHGIRSDRELSGWGPAITSIRANKAFLCLAVGNTLAAITFFQWGTAVSLYLRDLGEPEKVFGFLMAGNGLMIAMFELPISRWTQSKSFRHVIAIGFLLCGLGLATNSLTGIVPLTAVAVVAIGFAIFTIGEMVSMPVSSAYLALLAPEKMRGRYSGVMGFTWSFAHIIGPGIGLWLYGYSPHAVWGFGLLLGVASFAIIWRGQR